MRRAEQALIELISRHPERDFHEGGAWKGRIRDAFGPLGVPGSRLDLVQTVLLKALDLGVPREVMGWIGQGGVDLPALLARLSRRLKTEGGYHDSWSFWAVATWARALGLVVERPEETRSPS